jgi:hypothetical protein
MELNCKEQCMAVIAVTDPITRQKELRKIDAETTIRARVR